MAAKLNMSVSYLNQVENNVKMPSGKLLNQISELLEAPVSTMLFEVMDDYSFKDEET